VGDMRNAYRILVGRLKGRENLGDVDVVGRITLSWMLNRMCGCDGLDSTDL